MLYKIKYSISWFCLQNDLSTERITLTQLLVNFIDKKKLNQKYLIQKLEAQQFEFVSILLYMSVSSSINLFLYLIIFYEIIEI